MERAQHFRVVSKYQSAHIHLDHWLLKGCWQYVITYVYIAWMHINKPPSPDILRRGEWGWWEVDTCILRHSTYSSPDWTTDLDLVWFRTSLAKKTTYIFILIMVNIFYSESQLTKPWHIYCNQKRPGKLTMQAASLPLFYRRGNGGSGERWVLRIPKLTGKNWTLGLLFPNVMLFWESANKLEVNDKSWP